MYKSTYIVDSSNPLYSFYYIFQVLSLSLLVSFGYFINTTNKVLILEEMRIIGIVWAIISIVLPLFNKFHIPSKRVFAYLFGCYINCILNAYSLTATNFSDVFLVHFFLSYFIVIFIFNLLSSSIIILSGLCSIILSTIYNSSLVDYYEPKQAEIFLILLLDLSALMLLLILRNQVGQAQYYTNLYLTKVMNASIAHEVNVPVTGIKIIAEELHKLFRKFEHSLLKRSSKETKAIAMPESEYMFVKNLAIPRIIQRANSIRELISVILYIMRIQWHQFEQSSTDVHTLVHKTISVYFSSLSEPKIHVCVKNNFIIRSNIYLLQFIIANLIRNALKYAGDNAQIFIIAENRKLICRDNGVGIPADILKDIFKLYYTKGGDRGGYGIGLAFCASVMHNMGHNITCRSMPGRFTEMILHFSG